MTYATAAVKNNMLLAGIAEARADFMTALMIPVAAWIKTVLRMTAIFAKAKAVIWYALTATLTVLMINR
jgi:hypothetical protein